jgi:antitoxin component YwqK of YwqJK toxin-antitoxin module
MKKSIFLLFGILFGGSLVAQDESVANLFKVDYETPLTIEIKSRGLDEELVEAPVPSRKKRQNPKIFWGIKTKKGFTKKGFGQRTVTELFFYLKKKDYAAPDDYTPEFYYYDFKKKKIVKSKKVTDPNKVGVLHGHYVKKVGEQILEEGYFYKGKKHGRWMRYNTNDILQEKIVYWKGWPQESKLSFYDYERTKLREAIPVVFGDKQGTYAAFHPNGNVAALGEYKYDHRVGVWREYYENRRIKREVMYPENPYDSKVKPYIVREYSREGQLIYDRQRVFSEGG